MVKKLWHRISHLGVRANTSPLLSRHIILSNQLCVAFLAIAFMSFSNYEGEGQDVNMLSAVVLVLVAVVGLLLNHYGFTRVSRLFLVISTSMVVLTPLFTGVAEPYNVVGFAIAAVAHTPLPLLLFDLDKERPTLMTLLIYNALLVFLTDWTIIYVNPNLANTPLFGQDYFTLIKIPMLSLWFIVLMGLLFLKRINNTFQRELELSNQQVHAYTEEIQTQNEELTQANHAIIERNEAFRVQQEEIEQINAQLEEKMEEIEKQNALLQHQQETLQQKNDKLEEALMQLKQAQTQLVQSEKMVALGQLTAGIAHELNNPINYMQSGLGGLQEATYTLLELQGQYEALENSENLAEDLAAIKAYKKRKRLGRLVDLLKKVPENIGLGANRAAEIVRELRTFSRINEDDLKTVNIHEGIESTLVLLRAQYKGVATINRQFNTALPPLECYAGKLNQVFMNLITNAIHAVQEKYKQEETKGQITISTRPAQEGPENDGLVVEIADNGPGIPTEIMNRIFEPFFTTKEIGKGTGLGLSISNSIIADHHGELLVNSIPEKGTTFTITLPLRQPQQNLSLNRAQP